MMMDLAEDDEFSKKWRNDLVQIITGDRVVDNQLREQTAKKSLYLCELHERKDQMDLCKFKKYFSFLILIITVAAN